MTLVWDDLIVDVPDEENAATLYIKAMAMVDKHVQDNTLRQAWDRANAWKKTDWGPEDLCGSTRHYELEHDNTCLTTLPPISPISNPQSPIPNPVT